MTGSNGRLRSGVSVGQIVGLVLGILVLLLAAANLDETEVNLLVTSLALPLFIVIVAVLLIGIVVGWLLGRRRRR